jgi:hypothetical protein
MELLAIPLRYQKTVAKGAVLNQIRVRLASTAEAWIRSIFLVMN